MSELTEPNPDVRYADMGGGETEFDEFVARNVEMVHLERMDASRWFLAVYMPDGSRWAIYLGATNRRAKGFGTCLQDVEPNLNAQAADEGAGLWEEDS